jgi:TDG/mug DNA glycosylase family protein
VAAARVEIHSAGFKAGASAMSETGLLPLQSTRGGCPETVANEGGTANPSPFKERGIFLFKESMLPDYLTHGLDIVFVGINPGEYSDQVGHYFARKQNQFWTALYASGIIPTPLTAWEDARLLEFNCGLTDVVKRATANVDGVADAEFRQGGAELRGKLTSYAPHVICFVGLHGYRKAFDRKAELGAQPELWGESHLFIVPSTSPRNAYYRAQITDWFRRLKEFAEAIKIGGEDHA